MFNEPSIEPEPYLVPEFNLQLTDFKAKDGKVERSTCPFIASVKSTPLKKHSPNETFKFSGSKKSYFGQYSEFSNAENPPLSLFYQIDYSKKFDKNKLYSSVGYFREESQFNFNSTEFDSSLNSEFSDFLSLTIGNKFIKNNYNFDLQLNHVSKFESLLLNEYAINNKYDLERNRFQASIQKNNFLALNVILNNSYYFDERSSNGFSLNALTVTTYWVKIFMISQ